ncbi:ABC transporter permease [Rufibacter immobilis]|uniref:ABC transporter permease n=1 Tax=Rufibacter immobilis TaxID=1348778 RepID=A0A3M9MPI5_9BACT|nr:ABC transporter permease [Rufibacter immobilis]RNI27444.1 ABC transporter permease [Rufibacter immobilis]
MNFRSVSLSLLKFLFTLWLTVSCVFLLSRLLPAINAPKGMQEADTVIYGAANAATLAKVKSDYLKRNGLLDPLFYIDISLKGKVLAAQLKPDELDKVWVEKAVLRHGFNQVAKFYGVWNDWKKLVPDTVHSTLTHHLLLWTNDNAPIARAAPYQEITKLLKAQPSLESAQLLSHWQNLQNQRAPLYYHLPAVQWQGTNNAYHHWLMNLLQGNLGTSTQDYQQVSARISHAIGTTVIIGLLGLIMATAVAYFVGFYFAHHSRGIATRLALKVLYLLDSIPAFLIALLVLTIYVVAGGSMLPIFPQEGSFIAHTASLLSNPSVVLGSVCIALLVTPHLTLQLHRSLEEQLGQLYYRTARAKGLSQKETLKKHIMPNALLPSLTLLSEVTIGIMAGALVIEITFSLPGLGNLLAQSILTADYPVIVGITLLLLIFRQVVVSLTHFAFVLLDPRLRNG